jgi:hypothetical protein
MYLRYKSLKHYTMAGFEPIIFCSGGRCDAADPHNPDIIPEEVCMPRQNRTGTYLFSQSRMVLRFLRSCNWTQIENSPRCYTRSISGTISFTTCTPKLAPSSVAGFYLKAHKLRFTRPRRQRPVLKKMELRRSSKFELSLGRSVLKSYPSELA